MSAPLTTPSRVVASYPDYAQAQYAVDALADRKLPVDELAIVGAGLQSYEQITGRTGYGRAALGGLANGAVVGALPGWLLGLLTLVLPLVSVLVLIVWGLVIGAVVGAILGLIGHAALGGRRDFSSVSSVRASATTCSPPRACLRRSVERWRTSARCRPWNRGDQRHVENRAHRWVKARAERRNSFRWPWW